MVYHPAELRYNPKLTQGRSLGSATITELGLRPLLKDKQWYHYSADHRTWTHDILDITTQPAELDSTPQLYTYRFYVYSEIIQPALGFESATLLASKHDNDIVAIDLPLSGEIGKDLGVIQWAVTLSMSDISICSPVVSACSLTALWVHSRWVCCILLLSTATA